MHLQQRPLEHIIGHRGASAYAPENTFAAFAKAFELGCRFLEFDVVASSDGELFVFHDENLSRTTNGEGEIGLVTAEYLQSLDAGFWYSSRFKEEKIPRFMDVLHWLLEHNVQANIEIKPYPGQTSATTLAILSTLKSHWPAEKEWPLISSFDLNALALCRDHAQDIPRGLLLDGWTKDWLQLAMDLDCYSIHISSYALTQARAALIKQAGYALFVYTVNRKAHALRFFDWGVDAVFSDYPDLLL